MTVVPLYPGIASPGIRAEHGDILFIPVFLLVIDCAAYAGFRCKKKCISAHFSSSCLIIRAIFFSGGGVIRYTGHFVCYRSSHRSVRSTLPPLHRDYPTGSEYIGTMSPVDEKEEIHRSRWRELSQTVTDREILYYISGFPEGVRHTKIKSHMKEVFRFSFHGSAESHLEAMESEGLVTRERTRSGASVWHASPSRVMDLIREELREINHRERELRDLLTYLTELYAD